MSGPAFSSTGVPERGESNPPDGVDRGWDVFENGRDADHRGRVARRQRGSRHIAHIVGPRRSVSSRTTLKPCLA
jgi:hypothetical protein